MTFGGWSFIVVKDHKQLYATVGSEYNTTNQRMELMAVKEALRYISNIRKPCDRVIIYSDSAYIINCYLKEWYVTWMKNGWLNMNKKNVANQDLWQEIIPFFDNFWYTFKKVPAHQGNRWNEYCDELAQNAADLLKMTWRGTNVD